MQSFALPWVFSRAWQLFRAGWWLYLVTIFLAGVAYLALIIPLLRFVFPQALFLAQVGSTIFWEQLITVQGLLGTFLLFFIVIAIGALLQGTQWEITHQIASGHRAKLKDGCIKAIAHLDRYIKTYLLLGIGVFTGLVFLVVPGVLLLTSWMLAGYLVAREDLTDFAAVRRSMQLTTPVFFWLLLLVALLIGLGSLFNHLPTFDRIMTIFINLFTPPLVVAIYEERTRKKRAV